MTTPLYIIELHYTVPLAELDLQLIAHRAYLDSSYKKGIFVASGPQNPRTGGIIFARGIDNDGNVVTRDALATIMDSDPFTIHKLATYKITEFTAVKFSDDFAKILGA